MEEVKKSSKKRRNTPKRRREETFFVVPIESWDWGYSLGIDDTKIRGSGGTYLAVGPEKRCTSPAESWRGI
jgi:hypothetical protein